MGEWTLQELSGLCERLADICQTASITSDEASTGTTASGSDGSSVGAVSNGSAGASIVITGIRQGDSLVNFLWDDGVYTTVATPIAGASRPGTGDIFASILAADAVRGGDTTNLRAEGCELRRTVHRRKRKGRNARAGGRSI